jgi:hypothetical protein
VTGLEAGRCTRAGLGNERREPAVASAKCDLGAKKNSAGGMASNGTERSINFITWHSYVMDRLLGLLGCECLFACFVVGFFIGFWAVLGIFSTNIGSMSIMNCGPKNLGPCYVVQVAPGRRACLLEPLLKRRTLGAVVGDRKKATIDLTWPPLMPLGRCSRQRAGSRGRSQPELTTVRVTKPP